MKIKTIFHHSLFLLLFVSCEGQGIPDKAYQLKTAVLAAPLHQQTSATVYGYDTNGNVVKLKEGTNDFICIGDDPAKEGFSVAAYHKSLDPFMIRGRELKSQGMNAKQIFDQREQEVQNGTLMMPDKATLYVTTGTVNKENGEPENLYTRYVIYIPYATEESTGMPLSAIAPGAPWIMDPGTHRAHIMINPPK